MHSSDQLHSNIQSTHPSDQLDISTGHFWTPSGPDPLPGFMYCEMLDPSGPAGIAAVWLLVSSVSLHTSRLIFADPESNFSPEILLLVHIMFALCLHASKHSCKPLLTSTLASGSPDARTVMLRSLYAILSASSSVLGYRALALSSSTQLSIIVLTLGVVPQLFSRFPVGWLFVMSDWKIALWYLCPASALSALTAFCWQELSLNPETLAYALTSSVCAGGARFVYPWVADRLSTSISLRLWDLHGNVIKDTALQDLHGMVLRDTAILVLAVLSVTNRPTLDLNSRFTFTLGNCLLLAINIAMSAVAIYLEGGVFRRLRQYFTHNWPELGSAVINLTLSGFVSLLENPSFGAAETSLLRIAAYAMILMGHVPLDEVLHAFLPLWQRWQER